MVRLPHRDPGGRGARRICALACLTYTPRDEPARWAEAERLLDAQPDLADRDVHVAAVTADVVALRSHLERDPDAARAAGGVHGWPPLLSMVYSRVRQADPVGAVRLLLDAGADPDSGFLWGDATPPFTALTGVFGEGEQGPGRQPRHPQSAELARLLLDAGADPNDGQTLYNRMFGRDDSHLEVLFAYGLGRNPDGVWRRRLGVRLEPLAETLQTQVDWARSHGMRRRLALLAAHGYGPGPAPGPPTSVHDADDAAEVAAAVAHGATVDEWREGSTALHQAAWFGRLDLVDALLAAGADPAARDDEHGTTPEAWAAYARHPRVADRLRAASSAR